MTELTGVVEDLLGRVALEGGEGEEELVVERLVANRVAGQVRSVRGALDRWFRYYDGYDPTFS